MVGVHRENGRLLDASEAMRRRTSTPARFAFGQQHGNDLTRRAIAEKSWTSLLVPGDAVLFDPGR